MLYGFSTGDDRTAVPDLFEAYCSRSRPLGAEAVVYIGDPSGDIPQREGPGFVLLAAGEYPLMLRGLCGRES